MRPYTPEAAYVPMPPVKPPVRQFGIRMGGCEAPLEDLLKQSMVMCPADQCYTLVEVGSAGCTTLRAFKDIISETRGQAPWRVIGFDLPPDKAWSLDMEEVRRNGVEHIITEPEIQAPYENVLSLILIDDPRQYIRDTFPFSIQFAFIDGSHGKSCGLDFLALEQKISPGGLVVFHDYGEIEQGTDWQTVDREFINVRTYVHRLGLAKPCNEERKGWRFVGEIQGSRVTGRGDGNSAAVVQRTWEPLGSQPKLSLD